MGMKVNIGGNVVEILSTASIAIMAAVFLTVFSTPAAAKVTGVCSNCHTMHNSQGGSDMQTGYDSGSEAQATLLRANGCLGCHASSTSSTTYALNGCIVPVVYYAGGSAPTTYLAGGNFWWVKAGKGGDNTKGHNVFLNEADDLSVAPGTYISSCGANCCHNTLAGVVSGTLSELNDHQGCDGCHLNVMHHADDHANFVGGLVTSAGQGWYRFLSAHTFTGNYGAEGYEDGDWQASSGTNDHNEYLGKVQSGGWGFSGGCLGNTTTAFCTGCHGVFHGEQQSGGNWIRHPSDAVIPNSGEYVAYTTYNPQAPVARPSLTDWTGPSSTVTPGEDMVMCLSCHRPHGSPYPDMLRWDYTDMVAGGESNGNGCFVCHTNKDGVAGNP